MLLKTLNHCLISTSEIPKHISADVPGLDREPVVLWWAQTCGDSGGSSSSESFKASSFKVAFGHLSKTDIAIEFKMMIRCESKQGLTVMKKQHEMRQIKLLDAAPIINQFQQFLSVIL